MKKIKGFLVRCGMTIVVGCCLCGARARAVDSDRSRAYGPAFDSRVLFTSHAGAGEYFENVRDRSLAEAGASGSNDTIDLLLSTGVNINTHGKDGVTPLIWAFVKQNKSGFEHLLKNGANPNFQMTDGTSVVSYAAMHKDVWYITEVLNFGGNPNLENQIRSFTPICYSINSSNALSPRLEQVKILIQAGANLNWKNRDGDTPLTLAAIGNQYQMVYLMLKAGADPTIKDNSDNTIVSVIGLIRTDPNSETYLWRTKVIEFLKDKGISMP